MKSAAATQSGKGAPDNEEHQMARSMLNALRLSGSTPSQQSAKENTN